MPVASTRASEIGKSMPSRPRRTPASAERKKGWPENSTVGIAMAPEIRWKMSRVASEAPDHTATDSSITFIIAKNATPRRISRSRPMRSFSVPDSATRSRGSAS